MSEAAAAWFGAAVVEPHRDVSRWHEEHVITSFEARALLRFSEWITNMAEYRHAVTAANRRAGIASADPCSLENVSVRVWRSTQSMEMTTLAQRVYGCELRKALVKIYEHDVEKPRRRDKKQRDEYLARRESRVL